MSVIDTADITLYRMDIQICANNLTIIPEVTLQIFALHLNSGSELAADINTEFSPILPEAVR